MARTAERAFVGRYLTLQSALTSLDVDRSVLYLIDEQLLAWEYATRPGHEHLDWWDRSVRLRSWLETYIDQWTDLASPISHPARDHEPPSGAADSLQGEPQA